MKVRESAMCSVTGFLAAFLIMAVSGGILSRPSFTGAAEIEFRTIDGMGNNLANPDLGMAGIRLLRRAKADYSDGAYELSGIYRKSPRAISNLVAAEVEPLPNHAGASDWLWQWGQFLDHDLDLTTEAVPAEAAPIPVLAGDPFFDPYAEGGKTIGFNRSLYEHDSNPREQLNLITSFIDASNVYGSDETRAKALRTNDGTGKLKTSAGGLFLPFNTERLPNAGGPDPRLFLAGDVRANEQVALTAAHTLFVREHNRLCDEIARALPDLNGDEIYERARKIVGAQIQVITYHEFLPVLLGPAAIPPYEGYDPYVNPGISNEFSTAAFRLGHSLLSPALLRVNKAGQKTVTTSLKDAFFNPRLIHKGGGIEPVLRGLALQQAQEVDNRLVDGVRNFLFGEAGDGGFDLAALNIQRGRDHGLPHYNAVREAYGLKPISNFLDMTSDPEVHLRLSEAYESVDDMDLWVAGLAESHVPGALVGETFHAILLDQFIRLRDGDRFWYEHDPYFTTAEFMEVHLMDIRDTRLSDIIRRNTRIGDEIPDNVFFVPENQRICRGAKRCQEPFPQGRKVPDTFFPVPH